MNRHIKKQYKTAGGEDNQNYVEETVEIEDHYPEHADGERKIYTAIIYQDFTGEFNGEFKDSLRDAEQAILNHHGAWKKATTIPRTFSSQTVTYSDFESYIEEIDRITDGDDRLVLFINGHGIIENDEYCLELEDGNLIPENALASLLATLGPALDFLWLFSCNSEVFCEHKARYLNSTSKGLIIWAYHGDVLIDNMTAQANEFRYAVDHGETKIEEIYSHYGPSSNLIQFDYYPGYLDIPKLGPAYDEPSGGATYGVILVPADRVVITPF